MSTTWLSSARTALPVSLMRNLAGLRRAYGAFLYRRSMARTLHLLDNRTLKDIGISRGEIEALVVHAGADGAFVGPAPAFSSKSPSSLHAALKQTGAASVTTAMHGGCCSP